MQRSVFLFPSFPISPKKRGRKLRCLPLYSFIFLLVTAGAGLPQPALMRRALWLMAILFCVTMTKKTAYYFKMPLILRNFAVIKL